MGGPCFKVDLAIKRQRLAHVQCEMRLLMNLKVIVQLFRKERLFRKPEFTCQCACDLGHSGLLRAYVSVMRFTSPRSLHSSLFKNGNTTPGFQMVCRGFKK